MSKRNFKLKIINYKFLAVLLALTFVPFANAQEPPQQPVLGINLHYKDKQVTVTSVEKRLGFLPDYLNQPQEGYTLAVYGKDSSELFKVKFNFPLQVFTDDFSDRQKPKGKVETLTEANTTVTVPVFENAQRLEILDPQGQTVALHNLSIIVDPNIEKAAETPLITHWPWVGAFVVFLVLVVVSIGSFLVFINRKKPPVMGQP